MQHALHHVHSKKRQRKNPPKDQTNRFFEESAYVVGIATALFNLPQLIDIWKHHSAENISLTSWLGFFAASCFWLCYALYHREKALIFTFSLTVVLQGCIFMSIILNS